MLYEEVNTNTKKRRKRETFKYLKKTIKTMKLKEKRIRLS